MAVFNQIIVPLLEVRILYVCSYVIFYLYWLTPLYTIQMDTTALSKSNYLFCYIMFSHAYRIYFPIAVGISTPQDSQNL